VSFEPLRLERYLPFENILFCTNTKPQKYTVTTKLTMQKITATLLLFLALAAGAQALLLKPAFQPFFYLRPW